MIALKITDNNESLAQVQTPVILLAGAVEAEGKDGGAGWSIGGATISDVNFGGDAEQVVGKNDLDFSRVPSLQHERGGIPAQEHRGDLAAGGKILIGAEQSFETMVIAGGQRGEDLVSKTVQDFLLGDERVRGGLRRCTGSYEKGCQEDTENDQKPTGRT